MKFLLALTLVGMALAGDREHHKLKKWAMHKACESCFGKEASKMMMIKIKTAASKCLQVDAPELDLPMYKYPYRAVGALVDGAFSDHNADGHHGHPHGHSQGYDGMSGRPHGRPGGHHHQFGEEDYLNNMLKKVFFKKLVSKMIEEEFLDDDDDDMDDSMNPGPMRFFTKSRKNKHNKYRNRRQADQRPNYNSNDDTKKEMFELGDRLNAKLQAAKSRSEAQIGNYTCMLRECGVIDASNKLVTADEIIRNLDSVPMNGDRTDGWLRRNIEDGVRRCVEFAESVPKEILESCQYGPELAKVKMYKKCFKMTKLRTCMNYDVKQQLEENFGGSLEDLVETTQLEEEELLPLVMTLLHGPEMDMH